MLIRHSWAQDTKLLEHTHLYDMSGRVVDSASTYLDQSRACKGADQTLHVHVAVFCADVLAANMVLAKLTRSQYIEIDVELSSSLSLQSVSFYWRRA